MAGHGPKAHLHKDIMAQHSKERLPQGTRPQHHEREQLGGRGEIGARRTGSAVRCYDSGQWTGSAVSIQKS